MTLLCGSAGASAAEMRGCVCFCCPTRVRASPESTVPDDETSSCLINVRGEEEQCILGVAHQHSTWGDTTTEPPWVNRGRVKTGLVLMQGEERRRRFTDDHAGSCRDCESVVTTVRLFLQVQMIKLQKNTETWRNSDSPNTQPEDTQMISEGHT